MGGERGQECGEGWDGEAALRTPLLSGYPLVFGMCVAYIDATYQWHASRWRVVVDNAPTDVKQDALSRVQKTG